MKTIPLFIMALVQLLIALTISYKRRQTVNKYFIALVSSIALWTIVNATLDYLQYTFKASATVLDMTNRMGFFLGSVSLLLSYRLSLVFPYKKAHHKRQTIFTIGCIGFIFLIWLPQISGNFYNLPGQAIAQYSYGNYSWLIGLFALIIVALSSVNFISGYRNATGQVKKQTLLIFYGLVLSLILGVLFVIVIPRVTGSERTIFLGYYAPMLLTSAIIYSIVKHRLFDIRLVVVRSLSYALSLAIIGVITFTSLAWLSNVLDSHGVSPKLQILVFVTVTLLIGVLYQPFKKLFDQLTQRLFYRDAYETQDLLNEFNQVIVSTIDLSQLLMRSGQTIEKFIKPEMVAFAIREGEANTLRIITNAEQPLSKQSMEQIRDYIHGNPAKLLVTDMLEEVDNELKQLLQTANIGILARITTNPDVEGNGYIVMGYKKSGNMYNTQDTGAMEIVANELAIAMQNALQFEEIQKFNVTLQDKIDDATRKLKRTNDKLKQMDETKDEFISMASHQLRTPLTSVKGYLSMVLEGDAGEINEMQHKLLDQAFISSQRMVYLIADLLNVSRLRTGKFVIEAVSSNLADVVEGEVHQLIDTAKARGLTLTYQKPENFPSVMIDETKIRQVIMNFMDNAIYYSKDDGHITVELKDKGDTIEYTVTDDGIGVPKAEQHHLFTKFYRAANAKKARPDGTGLGLFMAKKVVVAQGGNIIFKSDPGKGSTFGFSFQKSKLAALAEANTATEPTPPAAPAAPSPKAEAANRTVTPL